MKKFQNLRARTHTNLLHVVNQNVNLGARFSHNEGHIVSMVKEFR